MNVFGDSWNCSIAVSATVAADEVTTKRSLNSISIIDSYTLSQLKLKLKRLRTPALQIARVATRVSSC